MIGNALLQYAGLLALSNLPSIQAIPFLYTPTTTFSAAETVTPAVVSQMNVTSHGPFTGPPASTTGALTASTILASEIPSAPPAPGSFNYTADGKLHGPEPAPFTPNGGLGTNGSAPVYRPQSDYDYQSLALALYQEWIELDLFHFGLKNFSTSQFQSNGVNADDRFLIEYMADQEVGHATLLTNMLGPQAPRQCTYNYPVSNVREFLDFNQKLTRWGESGVYGFLPHLTSRPAAQLLLQSIAVEARQQLIFRQLGGQFPMPVWHVPSIPQSWQWSLLAPYISSCPANQTRLIWQNFPSLNILNQPNPARINASDAFNETTGGFANTLSTANISSSQLCFNATNQTLNCSPAISRNRTIPLSYPGRQVFLHWDTPGKLIGPNNSYVTTTRARVPRWAAWVSQLNVTYSPLLNINLRNQTAFTFQPNVSTWDHDPAINGTMFLALTDARINVTPFNLSQINPHVAALGVYQAG
ncbi:protein rds1 [Trichoderma asperellum]|uniref:Protein rds1 n=1 Tax=Trichoderma asperellum TaxID=101201 RepID=A0A6V8QZW8_TRIAP|nr:protein rds1 [Trichoderma asperellum]